MKIYVACSSKKLRDARIAMNRLRADDHEIVGDWINHYLDNEITPRQAARFCKEGIEQAEVVVFLEHKKPSRGAWFEFGYATKAGKPVFVLTGKPYLEKDLIFAHCDNVTHVWSWGELLYELRSMENRPQQDEEIDKIPF